MEVSLRDLIFEKFDKVYKRAKTDKQRDYFFGVMRAYLDVKMSNNLLLSGGMEQVPWIVNIHSLIIFLSIAADSDDKTTFGECMAFGAMYLEQTPEGIKENESICKRKDTPGTKEAVRDYYTERFVNSQVQKKR